MRKTAMMRTAALVAVLALAGAACSKKTEAEPPASKAAATADTPAAGLAVTLNKLLSEHVFLAAFATGNALRGNTAGFQAAAAALDGNSNDVAAAIGSVYGEDARKAFDPLWKKHIGFVVSYTQGLGAGDKGKQDKAVTDLVAYAGEFAAFLESATEGNLPASAGEPAVKEHILSLKAVIDAQAAKDWTAVYSKLRTAFGHMKMVGGALAGAIVKQKKMAGSVDVAAAGLRTTLNMALSEHVWMAAAATAQALSGNTAGFKGAAAALEGNSNDIAAAVGSVYGADAQAAFDPLWKKHIGFFVDYTTGVGAKDEAKQSKAVADLTAYAAEFGAFLESATAKGLPKDTVAELVTMHILGLKGVVDAQAKKDFAASFTALRSAAGHMQMIADPLTNAIVKQFPAKFGG